MKYDAKEKQTNVDTLNNYMLVKTLSMFEWFNLPETLPQKELEKLLQVNGYAFITKHEGDLIAVAGGMGGKKDAYGNDLDIIVNNPHINLNKTFNIKNDGVLISNDDLKLGLLPYFVKQNTLIAENDLNMLIWGYNSRTHNLISADDDKTKESANQYLKKIVDGNLAVIGSNSLFDGIKLHSPNSGGSSVKDMVEYQQYIKSNLYNEVGLSSNFNMKRERLISSELDQAEDSLFPLVYNMMQNRIDAIEKLNQMFNLKIDVDFGSVWHHKNKKLVDGVDEDAKDETENVELETGELADVVVGGGENDIEQNQPEEVDQDQEREREQALDLDPEPEPETDDVVVDDDVVDDAIEENKDFDADEIDEESKGDE